VIRLATTEPNELRIDAARNREALLNAASKAFVATAEPSMRFIAREAGVGIATLYRNFPTREALVDAIYRDQVQRLTQGAADLLQRVRPAEAMRAWMDLFREWLTTKHGMVDTLRSMIDAGQIPHAETRDELLAAIESILEAGGRAGDLRTDVSAEDVAAGLIGIFTVTGSRSDQTDRLLDLMLDGLRPVHGAH
jgi:AcrR family transcriptional regulator